MLGRRGRKKHDLHGKQSGGNEFISDFILRRTGEWRTRKQVSSHLQVLKSFLGDNKPCGSDGPKPQPKDADCSASGMSLVVDIKPEKSNRKAPRGTAHKEAAGDYETSECDDASEYQPSQASYRPFPHRRSAPIEILGSSEYSSPTIRRVLQFSMALVDGPDSKASRHTYTSLQSDTASAPKALEDVNKWREMYPPLANYYSQGEIDCPIFLFDTHLSLTNHCGDSILLTGLSMVFSQGAHFTGWRSYPRFYEQNGCPVDLTKFYPESEPFDDLNSFSVRGTNDCELDSIALKSKWWVKVFTDMIVKKREVEHSGDLKLIREEEERAIQLVQGISVMQEIWATHRVYNHQPQRVAILLWKFDIARRGEVATTSWRRLVPPLSAYEIQSPHPPFEEPPITLDTTLRVASPYAAHYNAQRSIFSGSPAGDLFAAPLSENSSLSTTPTPGSCSFPSSTSTSFPSSVSNSTYPLYPSQESTFHSQDSAYPTLGSFDSQDSGYPLYEHHEIVEASHESYGPHEFADGSRESHGSQEVIYHSQDSLYQHGPDQLYEYPYQIVDAPVTAPTSHDFTGGQIHLSYAQTEDSQSSYEAPLIAPQANMMPQHQLIQHPEHFDQHDYLDHNPDDLSGGGGQHEFDESAHTQRLPQAYELNGLAIDYNEWEETLRLNPDLERHLNIDAVDEGQHIGQQYIGPLGQEVVASTVGEVPGEVQEEAGSPDTLTDPDRQSEYQ